VVPFLLTLLLGKPNPNGKKREGKSGPFFTFSEADLFGILEKGRELLTEGGSRNEGGGKLPLLECKLILSFFF
jgi:hypothetical protein